jgi:hypothetical protein
VRVITLAARFIWQWKPNLWTCLLFWAVAIGFDILNIRRNPAVSWRYFALLGVICNALVTLANGGFMPVLGKSGSFISVWVKANTSHRLLFLADRFWGFSIGDFFILGALLSSLLFWTYGKLVTP